MPSRPLRMPMAMAILISSSARITAAHSFSGTPLLQAPLLPPTPQPAPIRSGLPRLASTPARPLAILTTTAILISSSARIAAAHSFSETLPRQAPQLPPTALHPPIRLASVMSASPPARPLPISTPTAILISSSALTAAARWCTETPPRQALPIPPMPHQAPIPSVLRMSAQTPNRPLPISTATATSISSSAKSLATRMCSATAPRSAPQLPPTKHPAPIPSVLSMLATLPARPLPISTTTAISISSSAMDTATRSSSATPPSSHLPPWLSPTTVPVWPRVLSPSRSPSANRSPASMPAR